MKPKNSRKSYTATEKLEIVAYAEKHGNRAAAKHYGMNESSIRAMRKLKSVLKEMPPHKRALRGRPPLHPDLEAELRKWVFDQRERRGVKLTTSLVQTQALKIAEAKSITDCKFSCGWVHKFTERNRLVVNPTVNMAEKNLIKNMADSSGFSLCSAAQNAIDELPEGERENSTGNSTTSDSGATSQAELSKVSDPSGNIMNDVQKGSLALKSRDKTHFYPELEAELKKWVSEQREYGMKVSVTLIRYKALIIAKQKAITDYRFGGRWVKKFLVRNNLLSRPTEQNVPQASGESPRLASEDNLELDEDSSKDGEEGFFSPVEVQYKIPRHSTEANLELDEDSSKDGEESLFFPVEVQYKIPRHSTEANLELDEDSSKNGEEGFFSPVEVQHKIPRQSYSAAEKVEIIAPAEKHENNAAANHFRMNESSVRSMKKLRLGSRTRVIHHPDLEEELRVWVTQQRSKEVNIDLVRLQANAIAQRRSITDCQFSLSWVQKFLERNNLLTRPVELETDELPGPTPTNLGDPSTRTAEQDPMQESHPSSEFNGGASRKPNGITPPIPVVIAPKNSRNSYTASEKLEIIDFAEKRGNVAAANYFGLNESSVRTMKKLKAALIDMPSGKCSLRGKPHLFPGLETELKGWILEQRASGAKVNMSTVRLQALAFARQRAITHCKFSTGWIRNFMERSNLSIGPETAGEKNLPQEPQGDSKHPQANADSNEEPSIENDDDPFYPVEVKIKNLRKSYTAHEKLEIIAYAEEHGNVAAANYFGVNESSVRAMKKSKAILERIPFHKRTLRGRPPLHPDLEEELKEWFIEQRGRGAKLNLHLIRSQALAIAQNKSITDCTFSSGWVQKFMDRNNLSTRTEMMSADVRTNIRRGRGFRKLSDATDNDERATLSKSLQDFLDLINSNTDSNDIEILS